MSLKRFLTRLIWLCASPLIVLAIYLAGDHVYRMQHQRDLQASEQLQNIGTTIERDIAARIAALQALAASPLADDPARLAEFFTEAHNYRKYFSGHVVLANLSMGMVFNTRVELGTSLPKLPRPKGHAAAPVVLATGRPAVGDMFQGPIAEKPLVAVVVPVVRDGQVRSLLLSILATAQFQEHFDKMALPGGWRLTLLDGKDEVMAARPSSPAEKGPAVKGAARKYAVKLKGTPWSLVLEIPLTIYYAPIITAAAALLATILVVTLVSIQGGRQAGRRLARALATLVSPAAAGDSSVHITEIETARTRLNDEATAREKAEEDVRESEQRYRLTLDAAGIGLWDWDMEIDRWYATPMYFTMLGYDPEAEGQNREVWGARTHPDDFAFVIHKMETVRDQGENEFDIELRFRHKDGTYRWLNSVGRGVEFDENGKTTRMLGLQIDIIQRKQAELELMRSNEELQTVNRIIATTTTTTTTTTGVRDILENVLDQALAVTGLEGGTICMVTEDDTLQLAAHRATSDATIEDLSTNTVKVGDCLCGECARDHRPLVLHDRQEVLAFATREATRGEDIRFHAAFPLVATEKCLGVLCVFTRTDLKPAERNLKLLESVSAQIAMAVLNAQLHEKTVQQASTLENRVRERTRDLENAREALMNLLEDTNEKSDALAAANEKLQGLDRLKSLFIASMSHELRTPLNSVIGFSSILKDEWLGPVNDEQKKNLGYILDSGKHLLALINDVIDLSKVEAGSLEVTPKRFSLSDLVTEAVKAVRQSAEEKGLEIDTRIEPDELCTDRRRLLQCLLNLLSNAVKFTRKGSVAITTEKGLDRGKNPVIQLVVQDTGIGISPEDLDRLFKPFVRLHSPGSSEYPGTGLGLYLSQKIVREVLRGEIQVASTPGQGSRFTIEIPMTMPEEKPPPGV